MNSESFISLVGMLFYKCLILEVMHVVFMKKRLKTNVKHEDLKSIDVMSEDMRI